MCACSMKINEPLCSPKRESCGMVANNDIMVIPPTATVKEKGACPIELCDPNKSDFIMRVGKRCESASGTNKSNIEFDVFTPYKPEKKLEVEEQETQWDDADASGSGGKDGGAKGGKNGGKGSGGKGDGKKDGKKGKGGKGGKHSSDSGSGGGGGAGKSGKGGKGGKGGKHSSDSGSDGGGGAGESGKGGKGGEGGRHSSDSGSGSGGGAGKSGKGGKGVKGGGGAGKSGKGGRGGSEDKDKSKYESGGGGAAGNFIGEPKPKSCTPRSSVCSTTKNFKPCRSNQNSADRTSRCRQSKSLPQPELLCDYNQPMQLSSLPKISSDFCTFKKCTSLSSVSNDYYYKARPSSCRVWT